MKKTLLVILCLSMVTLAQGAIGFVPSKTTVATGETITIRLISDGACMGFDLQAVTDWSKGGVASNVQPAPPGILTLINPGYIENTGGILFTYIGGYATGNAIPAGTTLMSFNYTADSILGPVTIEPVPAGTIIWPEPPIGYTVGPSQGDINGALQNITGCTITVVPEPMTVVLLSLGGLMLRRRIV